MSDIKTKQPRTVEVKVLVPYAIILVMLVALAGVITGWNVRGDQETKTKAAAAEMVTSLTPKKEQK